MISRVKTVKYRIHPTWIKFQSAFRGNSDSSSDSLSDVLTHSRRGRSHSKMVLNLGNLAGLATFRALWAFLVIALIVTQGSEANRRKWAGTRREHLSHPCAKCDKRECATILPENCQGRIQQDQCGCCPICVLHSYSSVVYQPREDNSTDVAHPGAKTKHACDDIKCSKNKVCMLNIQKIPMCRCPTVFWCKQQAGKGRPVCGDNGQTYKSRCHLNVHECADGIDIKVTARTTCAKAERMELERDTIIPMPDERGKSGGRWKGDKKGAKRRGRKNPGGNKRRRKEEKRDRKREQRQKERSERKNRHKRRHGPIDQ